MTFDDAKIMLVAEGKGVISRYAWARKDHSPMQLSEDKKLIPVWPDLLNMCGMDVTLKDEDINADDWFYEEKLYDMSKFVPDAPPAQPRIGIDEKLTAAAYKGRDVGQKNKMIYLNPAHLENLPEGVCEGDLIDRGWIKAEPGFESLLYCQHCGNSIRDKRWGYIMTNCPACGGYNHWAHFQTAISC